MWSTSLASRYILRRQAKKHEQAKPLDVIRGQYMYLWGLLADGRRIVARGRGDREDRHLTVSFFCKRADPRAGSCETRDSLSIVLRVQIAR